jgi:hypothetical protein
VYGDSAVPLPVLSTILHAFHIAGVWHGRKEEAVFGRNRFLLVRKSGFVSFSFGLRYTPFDYYGYLQEQLSHARP